MPDVAPIAEPPADFSDSAADSFFSSQAQVAVESAPQKAAPVEKKDIAPTKEKAKVKAEVQPDKDEAPPAKKLSVFDAANKKKPDAETAPAPVSEADPFPEPEKLSETGRTGWKALKEAEAKSRNEAANFRAQLETYKKAAPAESADIAELRDKYQKAQDRLALVELESTDWYSTQFSAPKNKALTEAKEVLEYNGVENVDVFGLLGKPRKDFNAAVAEITKNMNSMDAQTVQQSLRQAHDISMREGDAKKNSSQLRQQIEEKNAATHKAEFEKVFSEIGYGDGFFEPNIPDDASAEDKAELIGISQAMKSAKAEAEKNAFGKLSPREAARIATQAAYLKVHVEKVIPRMHKEWASVKAENDTLKAENAKLKKSKNPGSFTGEKSTPAADGGPNDFSDASAEVYFQQNR